LTPDKPAPNRDVVRDRRGGGRLAVACLAGYMALLAFASLMPVNPDSALGATETRRLVNNLLHVPAYAMLAVGWVVCLERWPARASGLRTALVAFALAALYGGLLEAAQMWVPSRAASAGDLLLNTGGAACGFGFMVLWKRRSESLHG